MIRRAFQAPGVHFVAAGALLFVLSGLWRPGSSNEAETLVVSVWRLDQAREDFTASQQRPPTAQEVGFIVRKLVDEELLFRHAMSLGLDAQEPVQRRLAQVASFVSDGPGSDARPGTRTLSDEEIAERAAEARRLGLLHDDVVVRRILVDSAQRLIRSAVLFREPSEEAMQEVAASYPERFPSPVELDDVRAQFRDEVAELLADRWLEERLRQLRASVEIVLPEGRGLPAVADLWPSEPEPASTERGPL